MFETELEVNALGGAMTTFVIRPEREGSFSVAVLFMDGFGYRPQIKDMARRFASDGYVVVVPDLFYRFGKKISFDFNLMGDRTYRERLIGIVRSVTPAEAMADVDAALAAIADHDSVAPGAKVCVGYCMGARLALHAAAATSQDFVAAAGIHPGALVTEQADSPHLDVERVHGELYFAFAEKDESATLENVARFRDELARCGVKGVVERLPGTSHGFAMKDLPVYNHEAAERHFERTLDLWRRNLPLRAA